MSEVSRTFYRMNDDPHHWWHWRPKCLIWLNRGDKKKRGKTYVSLIVVGGRPTTYHLCPACVAEDDRHKTKDKAVFVRRVIYPKRTVVSRISTAVSETPALPYNRQLQPDLTRNPVTTVEVRRDEAY